MKVLYHHRTQGNGVEGIHIRGVIQGFRELGHVVNVISPPGVSLKEKDGFCDGSIVSGKWGRLWKFLSRQMPELFFELFEFVYNLYCCVSLRRAIRSFGPDVIYDRYALFNFSPVFLARRHCLKLVLEVNDATIITRSRPLFFKGLARLIEKKVLRDAFFIVTVSEHFKSLLVSGHDIAPGKIIVLPNAVDPARFVAHREGDLRRRLGLENRFVIGVVGAFVPWHGLDFLVDSLVDFLHCQKDVRVLLVGDGPVRSQVEERIRRRGLLDSVLFTGFVPAAAVPEYLSCIDLCVMPDSNMHGSPMKIFEYMAMGKPVLAPRYGPIEEVIRHGETGWLFPPRDGEALRSAVEFLMSRETLRKEMGINARADVLLHHTWVFRIKRLLSSISRAKLQEVSEGDCPRHLPPDI